MTIPNTKPEICEKCKQPKSKYIKEFERFCSIQCECDKQLFEDIEKEQFNLYVDEMFEGSNLGERYRNASFKTMDLTEADDSLQTAAKRCKKFCENFKEVLKRGLGIYLYGDKGTGKTYLAACIINELIRKEFSCFFTNFFEISEAIFKNNHKFLDKTESYQLVVFDDVGTELVKRNGSDNWMQGEVYNYLNKRYNKKLPTIFTANHSLAELGRDRGYAQKTIDRIFEMSTAVLEIKGKSFRLRKKDNDFF